MNVDENVRNKRKLLEKLRWYAYKITCMSNTNYRILQNVVPSKNVDNAFGPK